jgi:hypothetical protein
MNCEELIRQGNQLIAAAREGKIGVSEDDLKELQKGYLQREKLGDRIHLLKTGGYIGIACGLVVLVCGEPLWGYLAIFAGVYQVASMKGLETRAKEYIEILEREYPKLEKKEAA